jgi:Fe-S cluster assembly protein SufB
MLACRLEAYQRWEAMSEPEWANITYPKIDFQDL